MATNAYSTRELMVCEAARRVSDRDVVFVGIGLPNLACNLARQIHAPNLTLIYESGAVGACPERLPISIGDPALVTDSLSACSMYDIFANYLQGGRIDVGFLQGAQIDRFGNLNTTAIGRYDKPAVRLPGSGGACEIALLAKRVLVIAPQTRRSFPERVDFVTSPGFPRGSARSKPEMPGAGPVAVITNLGCYDFVDNEMRLTSLHPGCSISDVRENIGWDVRVADHLETTPEPSRDALQIIREVLDPQHLYI